MKTLYLDTETTGLSPREGAELVEIAIVDDSGRPLLDSFIKPAGPIPRDASRIHGITSAMVRGAPTFQDLWPTVRRVIGGHHVVIYNAGFDTKFFPDQLSHAGKVSCAMLEFAVAYGESSPYRGGYRWQRLGVAAQHIGYEFEGTSHRALADALACRAVWRWVKGRG